MDGYLENIRSFKDSIELICRIFIYRSLIASMSHVLAGSDAEAITNFEAAIVVCHNFLSQSDHATKQLIEYSNRIRF